MKVRTKKAGVVFLSAALIMAAGIPVYASEGADTGTQESSMNLTMSKESDYMMTIPKTTTSIQFGTVDTVIGGSVRDRRHWHETAGGCDGGENGFYRCKG